MIGIVRIALQRPYTFIVLALLILIVGPLAALTVMLSAGGVAAAATAPVEVRAVVVGIVSTT